MTGNDEKTGPGWGPSGLGKHGTHCGQDACGPTREQRLQRGEVVLDTGEELTADLKRHHSEDELTAGAELNVDVAAKLTNQEAANLTVEEAKEMGAKPIDIGEQVSPEPQPVLATIPKDGITGKVTDLDSAVQAARDCGRWFVAVVRFENGSRETYWETHEFPVEHIAPMLNDLCNDSKLNKEKSGPTAEPLKAADPPRLALVTDYLPDGK